MNLKKILHSLDPRADMSLVYVICKCGHPEQDHVIDFFAQGFSQCKRCSCTDCVSSKRLTLSEYVTYLSNMDEKQNSRNEKQ